MLRDNLDLFDAYDAEQERELRKLPVCKCCEEHIQQEKAVCIDGDYYCEDCEGEAWERVRKDFLVSIDV